MKNASSEMLHHPSGIHTLCKCWRACIVGNGDYAEKLYSCIPLSINKLNKKNVVFI
jgi:hypothetical protein